MFNQLWPGQGVMPAGTGSRRIFRAPLSSSAPLPSISSACHVFWPRDTAADNLTLSSTINPRALIFRADKYIAALNQSSNRFVRIGSPAQVLGPYSWPLFNAFFGFLKLNYFIMTWRCKFLSMFSSLKNDSQNMKFLGKNLGLHVFTNSIDMCPSNPRPKIIHFLEG